MRQVIEARAAHKLTGDYPAWETGLLVREVRHLPGGVQEERFEVDTGLLKAMLDVEKQAAIELSEWTEKAEVTGKNGAPVLDFASLLALARKAEQPDAGS